MKNYIFLLLLIIPFNGYSQDDDKLGYILPQKDGKVIYEGIQSVDSIGKDELYRRAKAWIINVYRSGKDVIQLDDKENYTLIGKGVIPTVWQVTFYAFQDVSLLHTLTLQFKDGRYKYEITDLLMDYYDAPSRYTNGGQHKIPIEKFGGAEPIKGNNTKKYYKQVNERIQQTIKDLDKAMRTPIKDW